MEPNKAATRARNAPPAAAPLLFAAVSAVSDARSRSCAVGPAERSRRLPSRWAFACTRGPEAIDAALWAAVRAAPTETRQAARNYAVAKAEQANGSYRAAAENYANAARQGNKRALTKLVAMTHAKKCEARSEAADALGTLRGKKAKLALKKLAHAKFKDEARNPGIFSCSSRRAAQKALERQARG